MLSIAARKIFFCFLPTKRKKLKRVLVATLPYGYVESRVSLRHGWIEFFTTGAKTRYDDAFQSRDDDDRVGDWVIGKCAVPRTCVCPGSQRSSVRWRWHFHEGNIIFPAHFHELLLSSSEHGIHARCRSHHSLDVTF